MQGLKGLVPFRPCLKKRTFRQGLKTFRQGLKTFRQGLKTFRQGLKTFRQGLKTFRQGLKTFRQGLKTFRQGLKTFRQGLKVPFRPCLKGTSSTIVDEVMEGLKGLIPLKQTVCVRRLGRDVKKKNQTLFIDSRHIATISILMCCSQERHCSK